ncbi:Sphingomyelin phosphodiesterase D [Purpureocillium takamizusanense]|uniref:Sphingomyelin phosphodiesterase D n=1 Tax=Purpureocillium takamizusanense TaxID=2060973 RepID=A0A9Q8VD51_9HYPO|nr:Sphingomyelin phosphodiesterase D [Purpureocillium takamizusanense]UNI22370.1 Sphingomyelin phosphodiesterase D [Purpureocillium takamizusanense]
MTAQSHGWWADHDNTAKSKGDTAEALFKAIADQRRRGMNVVFVWLDIKNPDAFPASNKVASIEALRDLARKHLEPAGIEVMYGFYSWSAWGRAYKVLSASLNKNEALNYEGSVAEAENLFRARGPARIAQRVFSRGDIYKPSDDIGTWVERGSKQRETGVSDDGRGRR